MLSRFFLNNSNKKILAPHAVDIEVTISSLIASLCFTFAEPFDDIFIFVKSSFALVSGNTNKSLRPKEGSTDRPSEWIHARSLNSYFAFWKIVVKSVFLYCIKQIDSMLPCVCSVNRSQMTSKCGKNISDTLLLSILLFFLASFLFVRVPPKSHFAVLN